jgi:hypothetical protein
MNDPCPTRRQRPLQNLETVDRAILVTDETRRAIEAYYGAGTGLWRAGAALRYGFRAARLMLVWPFHISGVE